MADDNEGPFANFVPSTEPPGVEPPKGKDKKKPRTKKKPAAASVKPAAPAAAKVAAPAPTPKKERKPRSKKPNQTRIYKIGIGAAIIALAGLTADDIDLLKTSAATLIDAPKKQRHRVVQALAKIFA